MLGTQGVAPKQPLPALSFLSGAVSRRLGASRVNWEQPGVSAWWGVVASSQGQSGETRNLSRPGRVEG